MSLQISRRIALFTIAATTSTTLFGAPPAATPKKYELHTVNVDMYPHKVPAGAGKVYTDIIMHCEEGASRIAEKMGSPRPLATIGHETAHTISSELKSKYKYQPEYQNTVFYKGCGLNAIEGIYLGYGKAVIVKSPKNMEIQHVGNSIPLKLQGTNFGLYFKDTAANNNTSPTGPLYFPTYILDEAAAYLLDAQMAMDLHDTDEYYQDIRTYKKPTIGETSVAGEFVPYVLALGYKIAQTPTAYENQKDKDRIYAAIQYLAENLAVAYKEGLNTAKYPTFRHLLRDYIENLRTVPEAAPLRKFAIDTYGKEWFDELAAPPPWQNPAPLKIADNPQP